LHKVIIIELITKQSKTTQKEKYSNKNIHRKNKITNRMRISNINNNKKEKYNIE